MNDQSIKLDRGHSTIRRRVEHTDGPEDVCFDHTMIDTSDRSRNTEIEEKKRQVWQGIDEQEHASIEGLIDWVIQRFPHRFAKSVDKLKLNQRQKTT